MLGKSAIFATVLAAAAAGMSFSANAAPIAAAGALAAQQESAVEKVHYWGGRTVTRCVHGKRVVMRINRWGRVVSRRVVGRCWFPHGHHHHRHHKHWY